MKMIRLSKSIKNTGKTRWQIALDFNLTKAQTEVLRSLSEGLTMKEIAADRRVSIHTVHEQLRLAYRRLDAKGSNNAIAIAMRAGLI
jgi:DNA-binding CsgD family transcriptional regulator